MPIKTFIFSTFLVVYLPLIIHGQKRILKMESEQLNVVFEIQDSRLSGKYTSYYQNGKIKAKGKLLNGNRISSWKLWDTLGNLRVHLKHKSPYEIKRIKPKLPQDPTAKFFYNIDNKFMYNQHGYYDYINLSSNNTVGSHYISIINKHEFNQVLFDSSFTNFICKQLKETTISTSSTSSDSSANCFCSPNAIEQFWIMEYWGIDVINMKVAKSNIMIAPVFNQYEVNDLCWINFKDIRNYLAQYLLTSLPTTKYVHSIDDWLYFRYFSGELCEVAETFINLTPKKPAQPFENEIRMIELENDLLLNYLQ